MRISTSANAQFAEKVGEARFTSATFRLFKLPPGRLEPLGGEDYGQFAVYKGTIPGAPAAYSLDERHRFEKVRKRSLLKEDGARDEAAACAAR